MKDAPQKIETSRQKIVMTSTLGKASGNFAALPFSPDWRFTVPAAAIAPHVPKAHAKNKNAIAPEPRSQATPGIPSGSIRALKGCVRQQRPVSLEEMEQAIARRGGAAQ
jgi:hypothetical protein